MTHYVIVNFCKQDKHKLAADNKKKFNAAPKTI